MSDIAAKDKWDIFISHASEDKADVAIPIAQELQKAGFSVWLDVHELTLGDNLNTKIDFGLKYSRFGLIVLSRAFFAKDWPKRELSTLIKLETESKKSIFPLLHGISHEDAIKHLPILADKLTISTEKGILYVAFEIAKALYRAAKPPIIDLSNNPQLISHYFQEPQNLVGKKIGDYYLTQYLGAGGSGIVFRASHKDLGEQIAIKIFYPLVSTLNHFNTILERGILAHSQLRHPNIVLTIDSGRNDLDGIPILFLVMNYIAGKNLKYWSNSLEEDSNAFEKRLSVAKQITHAMQSAHETVYVDETGFEVKGILHGDLKPANILIANGDFPVILDFHIINVQRLLDLPFAKNTTSSYAHQENLTQAFGTPGFMAPEQSQNGIVSIATDIYGLGISLCNLFLPRSVFLQNEIASSETLPKTLKKLLIDMTAANPRDRPLNMKTILNQLNAW